ncbi:DUF1330 domain-containing protein [Rhodovibrionaceae bacterium A322]
MPAYVVAMIDVTDAEGYTRYREEVPALIAKYGGRYLVRGGEGVIKEGDWPYPRVVVIEYPDMEAAEAFYHSEEYQAVLPHRIDHSVGTLGVFPGYEG